MNKIIDYIGSKEKLFSFLYKNISKNYDKNNKNIKVLDLFAGSTVFSKMLYEKTEWNISINDYQYFSYIISYYIDGFMDKNKLINYLNELDNLEPIKGNIFNEFSFNGIPQSIDNVNEIFKLEHELKCRCFFSEIVGQKADAIKNKIKEWYDNKNINENEKNILILFLINFLDKNANTTSVYAAYLKHQKMKYIPFYNDKIIEWISKSKNKNIKRYNLDCLKCLEECEQYDIIYIDPPYGTRDYYTLYHILNYIADLNFTIKDIKHNSKTAIPVEKKSNIFSQKETFNTISKIVELSINKLNNNGRCFMSYNNESFLTKEQFISIFEKLGVKYIFHTQEHQRYISRTDRTSHTKIEEWLIEYYI